MWEELKMPSDNDHVESGGGGCFCASLRAWAFLNEPEPFLRAPKVSAKKIPNMDIVPFYGLSYMRSTCVLQSADMVESSPLDGKFCFHLICST